MFVFFNSDIWFVDEMFTVLPKREEEQDEQQSKRRKVSFADEEEPEQPIVYLCLNVSKPNEGIRQAIFAKDCKLVKLDNNHLNTEHFPHVLSTIIKQPYLQKLMHRHNQHSEIPLYTWNFMYNGKPRKFYEFIKITPTSFTGYTDKGQEEIRCFLWHKVQDCEGLVRYE